MYSWVYHIAYCVGLDRTNQQRGFGQGTKTRHFIHSPTRNDETKKGNAFTIYSPQVDNYTTDLPVSFVSFRQTLEKKGGVPHHHQAISIQVFLSRIGSLPLLAAILQVLTAIHLLSSKGCCEVVEIPQLRR